MCLIPTHHEHGHLCLNGKWVDVDLTSKRHTYVPKNIRLYAQTLTIYILDSMLNIFDRTLYDHFLSQWNHKTSTMNKMFIRTPKFMSEANDCRHDFDLLISSHLTINCVIMFRILWEVGAERCTFYHSSKSHHRPAFCEDEKLWRFPNAPNKLG
jgi:hypothetical protein